MEHGAKFLAMKAAKKLSDKGSVIQKEGVLEAARIGGRAGAVVPLKKVVRATAVAAVKKARAEAKKAKKSKKEIAKATQAAAQAAVEAELKEQDGLIEKAAQKWYKAAIKEHPPSVFLAEDDDKPNNFKAPPSIHLSLEGDDDDAQDQVQQMEEASAKDAHNEISNSMKAQGPQRPMQNAKPTKVEKPQAEKVEKPEAAAKVAKAAAAAKQAAGKVVPEGH